MNTSDDEARAVSTDGDVSDLDKSAAESHASDGSNDQLLQLNTSAIIEKVTKSGIIAVSDLDKRVRKYTSSEEINHALCVISINEDNHVSDAESEYTADSESNSESESLSESESITHSECSDAIEDACPALTPFDGINIEDKFYAMVFVVWTEKFNERVASAVAQKRHNSVMIIKSFDMENYYLIPDHPFAIRDITIGGEEAKQLKCLAFGRKPIFDEDAYFDSIVAMEAVFDNIANHLSCHGAHFICGKCFLKLIKSVNEKIYHTLDVTEFKCSTVFEHNCPVITISDGMDMEDTFEEGYFVVWIKEFDHRVASAVAYHRNNSVLIIQSFDVQDYILIPGYPFAINDITIGDEEPKKLKCLAFGREPIFDEDAFFDSVDAMQADFHFINKHSTSHNTHFICGNCYLKLIEEVRQTIRKLHSSGDNKTSDNKNMEVLAGAVSILSSDENVDVPNEAIEESGSAKTE